MRPFDGADAVDLDKTDPLDQSGDIAPAQRVRAGLREPMQRQEQPAGIGI